MTSAPNNARATALAHPHTPHHKNLTPRPPPPKKIMRTPDNEDNCTNNHANNYATTFKQPVSRLKSTFYASAHPPTPAKVVSKLFKQLLRELRIEQQGEIFIVNEEHGSAHFGRLHSPKLGELLSVFTCSWTAHPHALHDVAVSQIRLLK